MRWPRSQALIRLIFGNRFHPKWKEGSFEVQKGLDAMIARYRQALEPTHTR
jgi:hypothetical protein